MDLSNENIIHIKDGDIEYLQFRKLLEFDNLVNCYTMKPLDYRRTITDVELENNYRKICKSLKIDRENIIRPHQSHTDVILNVSDTGEELFDVDGLVTDKTNIGLVLTFADCTPIMLYDYEKKVISNVHSGWRGTVQKIGQKAVLKMKEDYGCDPENIIACIGPCIGKCHFEVRKDVKDIFYNTFNYLGRNYDIIKEAKDKNDKFLIDTTLINRLILEEVGIKNYNIYESGICTVCNSEYMHSYRKDGNMSGRNVAVLEMI